LSGLGEARRTHNCGACGARLFSARLRDTGTLIHVEKIDGGPGGRRWGDLQLVPDLPGIADDQPPHVARTKQSTSYREHICPKAARPFSMTGKRKMR